MAASDFVSGLYVDAGYVDTTYIADTYVDAGYVTGITQGSASLASQASVSVAGGKLVSASASLTTDGAVLSASIRIRDASATLATSATLSGQPSRTRAGSSSMSGALAFGVSANLTIRPVVSTTTSASVSANGLRTRNASVDMFTSEIWDEMGTWERPSQDTWQGLYLPDSGAIIILAGRSSMSSSATLGAAGLVTRNASASPSTNATLTASGRREITQSSTLSTQVTFTASGLVTRQGTVLKASSGTLSVDGRVTRNATATLSDALDFQVNALRTINAATLQASSATLTAAGIKVVQATATLSTQVTITARSVIQGRAQAINTAASFSVSGTRIIGTQAIDLNSLATVSARGGLIRLGSSTMNGFTSVLSFGKLYKIDPYRVYAVPGETRRLAIVEETRKKFIMSENRVNTIQEETRIRTIRSETRKLVVQTLTLVDTPNSLLDTRE